MLNINENTIDAYKQKARAQIKEMKAKMQVFEAQAEKAGADMRIKYENNLNDWKSRFEMIEKKLDTLSSSTEDAWGDVQSGIDTSMKELRDAIKHAGNRFNS